MIATLFALVVSTTPVPGDGSVDLHLAISDHYRCSPSVVAHLHKGGVSDDELPVVMFLSTRAKVEPKVILKLRGQGLTWMEISTRYKLDAGAFHVELKKDPGPPYGNAYGHYKKHKKADWNRIVLSDQDVVLMVNLGFFSSHFEMEPDLVISLHGKHKSMYMLHADLKMHKAKMKGQSGKPTKVASPGGSEGGGKPKAGKSSGGKSGKGGKGGKGKGRG